MNDPIAKINARLFDVQRRVEIYAWIVHPGVTIFVQSAVWTAIGIFLPIVFCGALLHIAGVQDFLGYTEQELRDASFTFSATALLFVELVHSAGNQLFRPLRWAVGITLLVVSLLFSCGAAINQFLITKDIIVATATDSPLTNICFASAIVVYLAMVSATSSASYEAIQMNKERVSEKYGL